MYSMNNNKNGGSRELIVSITDLQNRSTNESCIEFQYYMYSVYPNTTRIIRSHTTAPECNNAFILSHRFTCSDVIPILVPGSEPLLCRISC